MTGASASVFLDTNVLVYAYDPADRAKQGVAAALVAELAGRQAAAISTQVLSEFFNSLVRKVKPALPMEQALESLRFHMGAWTVIGHTAELVLQAALSARSHKINFWDAQIWAAARMNGIPVVLSEDFASGSAIDGVRFVNPFAAGFRLADWL